MKCEEQQEYVSSSACSHAATAVQLYMCGVCVCVCVCVLKVSVVFQGLGAMHGIV
jgi:hypothetical protein